jgi:hypothetical protein
LLAKRSGAAFDQRGALKKKKPGRSIGRVLNLGTVDWRRSDQLQTSMRRKRQP